MQPQASKLANLPGGPPHLAFRETGSQLRHSTLSDLSLCFSFLLFLRRSFSFSLSLSPVLHLRRNLFAAPLQERVFRATLLSTVLLFAALRGPWLNLPLSLELPRYGFSRAVPRRLHRIFPVAGMFREAASDLVGRSSAEGGTDVTDCLPMLQKRSPRTGSLVSDRIHSGG